MAYRKFVGERIATGVVTAYDGTSAPVAVKTAYGDGYYSSTPTSDFLDAKADAPCLPDAFYLPFWDNRNVVSSDSKGNTITGTGLQTYQFQKLCECVRADAEQNALYSRANSQQRVDECWHTAFPFLRYQRHYSEEQLPFPEVLPQVEAADRARPRPSGADWYNRLKPKNFPNPCLFLDKANGITVLRYPIRCGEVNKYSAPYQKLQTVERVPIPDANPLVRSILPTYQTARDTAAVYALDRNAERIPSRDSSPGAPWYDQNRVPYLKELMAAREKVRATNPLSGVSSSYEFSPDMTKKNLWIAGTILTAVAVGAAVHLLTRKK